jgi:hypothetical protein
MKNYSQRALTGIFYYIVMALAERAAEKRQAKDAGGRSFSNLRNRTMIYNSGGSFVSSLRIATEKRWIC